MAASLKEAQQLFDKFKVSDACAPGAREGRPALPRRLNSCLSLSPILEQAAYLKSDLNAAKALLPQLKVRALDEGWSEEVVGPPDRMGRHAHADAAGTNAPCALPLPPSPPSTRAASTHTAAIAAARVWCQPNGPAGADACTWVPGPCMRAGLLLRMHLAQPTALAALPLCLQMPATLVLFCARAACVRRRCAGACCAAEPQGAGRGCAGAGFHPAQVLLRGHTVSWRHPPPLAASCLCGIATLCGRVEDCTRGRCTSHVSSCC